MCDVRGIHICLPVPTGYLVCVIRNSKREDWEPDVHGNPAVLQLQLCQRRVYCVQKCLSTYWLRVAWAESRFVPSPELEEQIIVTSSYLRS